MKTQVITIKPDGSIHGLVHKEGEGIDLRVIGAIKKERVTLVEFDEGKQRHFIHWFRREDDRTWTVKDAREHQARGGRLTGFGMSWDVEDEDATLYFHEYSAAVRFEVAYIQALQVKGEMKF